jgi:hypothetical protein
LAFRFKKVVVTIVIFLREYDGKGIME